jgi:hypothetical protein
LFAFSSVLNPRAIPISRTAKRVVWTIAGIPAAMLDGSLILAALLDIG